MRSYFAVAPSRERLEGGKRKFVNSVSIVSRVSTVSMVDSAGTSID
jgi:hypothetical protein